MECKFFSGRYRFFCVEFVWLLAKHSRTRAIRYCSNLGICGELTVAAVLSARIRPGCSDGHLYSLSHSTQGFMSVLFKGFGVYKPAGSRKSATKAEGRRCRGQAAAKWGVTLHSLTQTCVHTVCEHCLSRRCINTDTGTAYTRLLKSVRSTHPSSSSVTKHMVRLTSAYGTGMGSRAWMGFVPERKRFWLA